MSSGATDITADADCDFCEIVRHQEYAREVLRNERVLAFFPLEPATLGHTMIVPTQHLANIWHLDDATAGVLATATLDVAHAIRDALRPDGLNIIQSNGEAATQTVGHLHVHVVPRWHDDAMGPIWPEDIDWTNEQLTSAQQLIRGCLRPAP